MSPTLDQHADEGPSPFSAGDRLSLRALLLGALAAGLSTAALVAMTAILTRSFDALDGQLVITSLSFSLFTALGGAGMTAIRSNRSTRHLGRATIVAVSASFALLMGLVWLADPSALLWRAWGVTMLIALAGSHACLMLASRRDRDPALVSTLVVTSITAMSVDSTFGVLAISGVVHEVNGGMLRLLANLVIVMLLTSVLPTILRRISSLQRPRPTSRDCTDAAGHVA
jgi:hypothetical protein